jgi:hypothetical protein
VTDTGQDFHPRARERAALAFGLLDRDVDVCGAEHHQRVGIAVAQGFDKGVQVFCWVDR